MLLYIILWNILYRENISIDISIRANLKENVWG